MHQDVWMEVIQFLAPIDILASLVVVNSNMYELIGNCVVSFEDISKACESNWSLGLKIIVSPTNKDDHVLLLGNSKYFIRLYLLQLAMQLGNEDPENGFDGGVSNILDHSQLQLLNFYRSKLFPDYVKPMQQEEGNYEMIKYVLIGEFGTGKTSFFSTVAKIDVPYRVSMVDFHCKVFQIPNEINCKQQLWDIERFFSKQDYVKNYAKYKLEALICFSMDHRETFDRVGEFFPIVRQYFPQGKSELGIIMGLYPNYSRYQKTPVTMKEAVKKAFEFGKSIFVKVDSENLVHVHTPFWFAQLQFTYFHNVPPPPRIFIIWELLRAVVVKS